MGLILSIAALLGVFIVIAIIFLALLLLTPSTTKENEKFREDLAQSKKSLKELMYTMTKPLEWVIRKLIRPSKSL